MSFEAHITYSGEVANTIKEAADNEIALIAKLHWSFSKIDGDPVLGKGIKCYLTAHHDDYDSLLKEMLKVSNFVAAHYKLSYLRLKIENVVFDTAK